MENHIDKVIYIVIAIVITIASSITKANKKKKMSKLGKSTPTQKPTTTQKVPPNLHRSKPMSQTSQPSSKITDLDSLFASLQKPKPKKQEVEKVVETLKSKKHERREKVIESTPVIQVEEETGSLIDEFDPQKAIIYSEIMNRRYD